LVKQLEGWCQRAEENGILALQEIFPEIALLRLTHERSNPPGAARHPSSSEAGNSYSMGF
jgi:hypothetical protein